MATGTEALDAVTFFRGAFTIVLALALGEALKQFVADKVVEAHAPVILWERLPALLGFLLLMFPFYHGMVRYFSFTYSNPANFPRPYSVFLMIDGLAFLTESALFFIMSRALSITKWKTFYGSVVALLAVDSAWAFTVSMHGIPIVTWVILNAVCGALLVAMLLGVDERRHRLGAGLGLALMFVRTVLDYVREWNFYFPPLPDLPRPPG